MSDLGSALIAALRLVADFDAEFVATVLLSLRVSLTATAVGFCLGAPCGAALAVWRWRGRGALIILVHALLGLPPVVVGLFVYVVLSRSGPLGTLGLLFTPTAMVIAQTILVLPIACALSYRLCAELWSRFGDALLVDGASRPRAIVTLLAAGRTGLVTVFLAAFGRAIAEVGAIIVVGGNIRGVTRTMTTTIALDTSRGDLSRALAVGLVLIALTLLVSTLSLALARVSQEA